MVPYISRFQNDLGIESMLHVQVPGIHIWRLEILGDAHDRARTAGRDAAINRACWEQGTAANVGPIQSRAGIDDQPVGDVAVAGCDANATGRNSREAKIVIQSQE